MTDYEIGLFSTALDTGCTVEEIDPSARIQPSRPDKHSHDEAGDQKDG